MAREKQSIRSGFTLVELLVVIVIIAILGAMVLPAIAAAMTKVQNARIHSEIMKLDGAIKSAHAEFMQMYPPDGTKGGSRGTADYSKTFATTAFPDSQQNTPPQLDAAKSLVYWISRVNKDKTKPFSSPTGGLSGTSNQQYFKFFDFQESRIYEGRFYPPNADPTTDAPYVYFNHHTYANATYSSPTSETIKPYHYGRKASGGGGGGNQYNYASPDTFQIIAGGMDKRLGKGGQMYTDDTSSSDGIIEADEDNIVNFDPRVVKEIKLTQ